MATPRTTTRRWSSVAALLVAIVPGSAHGGAVERGRYLVERVAMCGECHTPRREDGTLDRDRWLEGGPIPVHAPAFATHWAIVAPRIAGLTAYTDEQAIRLLTSGIARSGRMLRPPMPTFRLSGEDARAVIAYLRSLR